MKHWQATTMSLQLLNSIVWGGSGLCSKSRKETKCMYDGWKMWQIPICPSSPGHIFHSPLSWPHDWVLANAVCTEMTYATSRPGPLTPPAWSFNFSPVCPWMWMPRETFVTTYWRWLSFGEPRSLRSSWNKTVLNSFY